MHFHQSEAGKLSAGVKALCLVVPLLFSAAPAFANDLSTLLPGVYVDTAVGCDFAGGAGTVEFDGKNFAEHYQVCSTVPKVGKSDGYLSTCDEHQGPDRPTVADVEKDPNRETHEMIISVTGPKAFTMNSASYGFCGALQ